MMYLGKNRVYDIGEIETLKSTAVSLLGTGIDSCISWDYSISELNTLQSQTPVKSHQLSSALSSAGKLYQSDYEVEKCWVEGALNNIITNIPAQDATGVSLLEPLSENLQFVMGMIEDLAGCIEAAGTNLTLSEFKQKVENVKQEWDETSLEENIEEFETSYLGMVKNTNYFTGLSSGFFAVAASEIYDLTVQELLKKLDLKTENSSDELQEVETEPPVIECYAIPTDHKAPLSEEEMQVNAEYIYDYLSKQGWTTEAICGLLGNIQRESKLNPGEWEKLNNETKGYGIVQWTSAYKKLFWWMEEHKGYEMGEMEYIEDMGDYSAGVEVVNNMSVSDPKTLIDLQLEYLIWSSKKDTEYEHKEWIPTQKYDSPYKMSYEEYICSTASPEELALVFHASYERSNDTPKIRQERIDNAEKWYEYFTEEEAGE